MNMGGPTPPYPEQGDWKGEAFRRKVIMQIEEAVRNSNTPVSKSSVEMENHVYNKAKSRDEYLALVARLILHVKDINNQNRNRQQQQQQQQQQQPQQPPQPGQAGMAPGMVQQAGVSGMGQLAGMQDPINALQNMAMSGGAQQGMMQGIPASQQQLQQQQQQQHQQRQQQMMHHLQMTAGQHGAPRPPLQRQDAFIVTTAQTVQQVAPPQQSAQMVQSMAFMPGGMQVRSPYSGLPGVGNQASPHQGVATHSSQGAVPSPVQVSSQQQPAGSPMGMMTSPSPHVPSPGPRSSMSVGAPSPSMALNTPGNPGSVGASPSPAGQTGDEQAYLDKLKQLSIYIEPLWRMIKKTEDASGKESDHRKNDINKLRNLHEILTNPSKKVPMTTLAKCEQVLEKIHFGPKSASSTISSTSGATVQAPHTPHVHMCQPLLDSVAAHITSPSFNHTLQKTFGPAMTAMFGNPIRAPSPPPKRQKVSEDKKMLPDILQGEVARLDRRFRVKLDPIQHAWSQDVHLICRLDDQNLPNVPPILIKIPSDYPENSPECSTSHKDYESTPFLQNIQKALVNHLVDLPRRFSFTSLLDMWEMSVRKACGNKT